MKKNQLLVLLITLITPVISLSQETTIQFPYLDFHMGMNQDLQPSISYNAEANIIVGDKSGLIFSIGVFGENLNLQSGLNDLIKLNNIKFSITPNPNFSFHTFYGQYKYLGLDPVIPRGFQFNYTPNTDYYGYKTIDGAGLAAAFPVEDGRYEPELMLYSSNQGGIDYLNFDFMTTFRFEKWYMELYTGIAIPTIGSLNSKITGKGGFSIFTNFDYANMYFAVYVPAYVGDSFTFDDIYFRLSQHLLINGFEQTFSIYSLGAESGNISNPLIGFNNIPDLNIYLSIGGRHGFFGYGVEYGFIYGLYENDFLINNLLHLSQRVGAYTDMTFLGLTYKLGLYYTLPNSPAYFQDVQASGELGFYVSVYGRS